MQNHRIIGFAVRALCILAIAGSWAVAASAQDTVLMTYQGYLTDGAGVPLNSNVQVTFGIYADSVGFPPLWSETHTGVPVLSGLVTNMLGSKTALPASVLEGSQRYLGIRVNGDAEMVPRVRLTSSPRAAVATRMFGDITTAQGALMLKQGSADSNLVVRALSDGASIRMFDPLSNPLEKQFELRSTTGSGASMGFFSQGTEVMGVEPSPFNSGFAWRMFDPQPEPPGVLIEILTEYSTPRSAGASTPASTSLRMFGNTIGATEPKLVDLSARESAADLRLGPGTPTGSGSPVIHAESNLLKSELTLVGPAGGPSAATMVLSTTGGGARLGIGTATPSQALEVVGNICYTGSIGTCSDARFKTDVRPIGDALATIEHLNGIRYYWKTSEHPERNFSTGEQVGVLAQEVKEVLPEAVTLQSDGYFTVDYTRLTPVLLEAVKELKKQNEQLTRRIEALEQTR